MKKIYIIIQSNAYDGFERPYDDVFYLTNEDAQKQCDSLNKFHCGDDKRYWSYDVYDLDLAAT